MGIQEYLQEATEKGASDLFIVAGLPLTYKINRKMVRIGERLMPEDTKKLIEDIYEYVQLLMHPILFFYFFYKHCIACSPALC